MGSVRKLRCKSRRELSHVWMEDGRSGPLNMFVQGKRIWERSLKGLLSIQLHVTFTFIFGVDLFLDDRLTVEYELLLQKKVQFGNVTTHFIVPR